MSSANLVILFCFLVTYNTDTSFLSMTRNTDISAASILFHEEGTFLGLADERHIVYHKCIYFIFFFMKIPLIVSLDCKKKIILFFSVLFFFLFSLLWVFRNKVLMAWLMFSILEKYPTLLFFKVRGLSIRFFFHCLTMKSHKMVVFRGTVQNSPIDWQFNISLLSTCV